MRTKILTLCFIALFFGCEKEKQFAPDYNVFGFKDGAEWNAKSIIYFESADSITLQVGTFNQVGEIRSHLSIIKIPYQTGKYTIRQSRHLDTSATAGRYYTVFGDVLDGIFDVYEGDDNFIEILEVDKCSNFVKGKFQVTYIQDTISNPYRPQLPDTVRFSDCIFSNYAKKSPVPDLP